MVITYETIKSYYDAGAWDRFMVAKAVAKGKITAAEYQEITGEVYTA